MQTVLFVLFLIYAIAGHWACNQTIYANKIRFGTGVELFMQPWVFGVLFGWALIPWAIIKKLLVG